MQPITILEYRTEHQQWFEKFNRYWIEKHFVMEPIDEFVLTNPGEALLKPGGAILMAAYDGEMAGTVALRKIDNSIYEFTKMAVDEKFRRKGIAEALSHASFEKARELGAGKVILYSNSILQPAIRLYEKLGFKHVPVGDVEYKRSDVKMEISVSATIPVNL
ncbi:MAG TPA: GNAT family N-acetyltransferase [Ferruginibacter sp.]|nr:GNAT family N-acetyltransferase [Ferruginibacter sp.]